MVKFAAGLGLSARQDELGPGGGQVQRLEEMMFPRLQLQVRTHDRLLVKGWKGSWGFLRLSHWLQTDADGVRSGFRSCAEL